MKPSLSVHKADISDASFCGDKLKQQEHNLCQASTNVLVCFGYIIQWIDAYAPLEVLSRWWGDRITRVKQTAEKLDDISVTYLLTYPFTIILMTTILALDRRRNCNNSVRACWRAIKALDAAASGYHTYLAIRLYDIARNRIHTEELL